MKKTPWFPAKINPVRRGNYEVMRKDASPVMDILEWCGFEWRYPKDSLTSSKGNYADMSGDNKWRGLAQKP